MAVEIGKERIEFDRLGAIRLRVTWKCDTRQEALRNVPLVHEGLPLASGVSQPWISKNGEYLVDASYEGVINDPDPQQDEYEIITEEREVKLETFPDQEKLKEEFGATVSAEGKLIFPPTLPKPPTRLGTPLTLDTYKGTASETPNPLWNATTYAVPHSTAIMRIVRRRVPSNLEKQARTVIDRLPSGFQYSGPKTRWYVKPLQKRKRGNAWEIEWTAFEVSDFNDLQVLLALQGRAREQGLTVTGLTTNSL